MLRNVSQDNLALPWENLLEAIRREDVSKVRSFQSLHPELFQVNATAAGTQNPLLLACEHGSGAVAILIAQHNPRLARTKDQFGRTPLHLACEKGLLSVVQVLVKLDVKLCLVKDRFSLIPLQTAVKSGYPGQEEVIRTLITACPESVRRHTSGGETIFHLAVKSNLSTDGFASLLEEAKSLNMQKLLHKKDQCGDTVLHIATSSKQVGIVKLLIPLSSSTTGPMVRVNTLNKSRQTALDICYENSRDLANREIVHILYEAGAVVGHASPSRARVRWNLETKNVILVVLGVVIGAAFTAATNFPTIIPNHNADAAGNHTFEAREVVSGSLPFVFYVMVFNTSIVVVAMCSMVILLWSLPFRPVVLFLSVTMGIDYGLIVSQVVPEFWVRIGHHDKLFSSSLLVWLLAIAFILCGAVAYQVMKCIFWCLSPFAERLITGKPRNNVHAPIFYHNGRKASSVRPLIVSFFFLFLFS